MEEENDILLESRANEMGLVIREILKQFQSAHDAVATGPHTHLSHNELGVIEWLAEEGPQMMRSIASHLGVAVNSLTAIVDGLEKKAIVTRIRSAEDRRVVHVELTALGRETASSARLAKTKFHKSLLSNLSDDEQKHLLDLFRKIAQSGWSPSKRQIVATP